MPLDNPQPSSPKTHQYGGKMGTYGHTTTCLNVAGIWDLLELQLELIPEAELKFRSLDVPDALPSIRDSYTHAKGPKMTCTYTPDMLHSHDMPWPITPSCLNATSGKDRLPICQDICFFQVVRGENDGPSCGGGSNVTIDFKPV